LQQSVFVVQRSPLDAHSPHWPKQCAPQQSRGTAQAPLDTHAFVLSHRWTIVVGSKSH
jgi:hypothetical protein